MTRTLSILALLLAIHWDCLHVSTLGFTVERWTGNGFVQVGFVNPENIWRTNAITYTYRFPLTNSGFYRVGVLLP